MRLRLTKTAARQLDRVLTDIAQHHPRGARNVRERIQDAVHLLLGYPHTGRRDIRRMVVSPYPYLLTDRVGDREIVIRGIRHASRRPLA